MADGEKGAQMIIEEFASAEFKAKNSNQWANRGQKLQMEGKEKERKDETCIMKERGNFS